MKNLAKLFLQSKQQSGKVKPRESASTARKVGQMRNTVRQMTGYKKGGTMENKQKGGVASPPARKAPKGLGKLMAARRRTKMSPMQMDRKKEGYRARVEKGGGKVMFADEMDRLKGESKKSQKSRIKKGLKLKAGGLAMRGYGIAKRGH